MHAHNLRFSLHVYVLPACMAVYHTEFMVSLEGRRPGMPGTGVIDGGEPLHWCQEVNFSLLQQRLDESPISQPHLLSLKQSPTARFYGPLKDNPAAPSNTLQAPRGRYNEQSFLQTCS